MKFATLAIQSTIFAALVISNAASASTTCNGGGYIKAVALNNPGFTRGHIGIQVLHDDGSTKHYVSHQNNTVTASAEVRALLQLANSALISQSKVWVFAEGSCYATDRDTAGRMWTPGWSGLWIRGE